MHATGGARIDIVAIEIVLRVACLNDFKTIDFRKRERE